MNKNIKYFIGSLFILAIAIMIVVSSNVTANWPALRTGQATTTSGTPVAMPNIPIRQGLDIVIKAQTGNTGKITLGYSTTTALFSGTDNFSLLPGESVELNLTNANLLYFDASTTGDGVEYIIETDY